MRLRVILIVRTKSQRLEECGERKRPNEIFTLKTPSRTALLILQLLFPGVAALAQSDLAVEEHTVDYLKKNVTPGKPLIVSELYNKVFTAPQERKTIIDMTAGELSRYYPNALRYLKFNPDQDELDFLLNNVGERVKAFSAGNY